MVENLPGMCKVVCSVLSTMLMYTCMKKLIAKRSNELDEEGKNISVQNSKFPLDLEGNVYYNHLPKRLV